MTEENQVSTIEHKEIEPSNNDNIIASIFENHELINNMDIDKIQALINMQNSHQNRKASIEYNQDFAEMQNEMPIIPKTKKGHNSNYAPYDEVKKVIQPIMGKFGFRDSYSIEQKEKSIKVTAKISHKSGHYEETTVDLPYENSGSKNDVQAVGSSISYGKRYAVIAALGLSTSDDVDGQTKYMESEEFVLIKNSVTTATTIEQLNKARDTARDNKPRMGKDQQREIAAEIEKTRVSIIEGDKNV